MLRIIRWIATGLCGVLLLAWAALWLQQNAGSAWSPLAAIARLTGWNPTAAANSGGLTLGGPFSLLDHHGRRVTEADFRGKWMLIYFGYTYCPDICPTELQTISTALDDLGDQGAAVVPVFVTVDPERDTPAALADYVKLFDERLIGLTGSPAEIADVARRFRVYAAKVPQKGGGYVMDHSSFLYLVGPDGVFRALFRRGMKPEELAAGLKSAMASN